MGKLKAEGATTIRGFEGSSHWGFEDGFERSRAIGKGRIKAQKSRNVLKTNFA